MTYLERTRAQVEALRRKDTVRILSLETSCDETAAAIVENGRIIRANVVFSQIDLHALYGGVVPEIASRAHSGLLNSSGQGRRRGAGDRLPRPRGGLRPRH